MADAVSVKLGGMGDRARAWIAEGRYASMNEVVLEGLRALEREQEQRSTLYKAKVEEALANPGPGIPVEEAFARIRATPIAT